MDSRRLLGFAGIGLVIVLIIWLRVSRRADVGKEALAEAMTLLSQAEGYADHQKLYDAIAKVAHAGAMGASYTDARRRKAASFDADRYMSEFFEQFIIFARDQGHQDIVKSVLALRENLGIPEPSKES